MWERASPRGGRDQWSGLCVARHRDQSRRCLVSSIALCVCANGAVGESGPGRTTWIKAERSRKGEFIVFAWEPSRELKHQQLCCGFSESSESGVWTCPPSVFIPILALLLCFFLQQSTATYHFSQSALGLLVNLCADVVTAVLRTLQGRGRPSSRKTTNCKLQPRTP